MNRFTIISLSALLAAPIAAQDHTDATKKADIVDTAVAAGSFKTLAAALGAANLVDTLKGKGPFTVFAPTDAAFAKLPKGTVATLLKKKNLPTLTSILTYHVVAGEMPAKMVLTNTGLVTLNGQRAALALVKKKASIGGAQIVTTDIQCSNGVIHVIDAVMMPATGDIVDVASKAGTFKTLIAAAKAAGLVDTLKSKGPFTVLAPNDAAFAKLPAGTVAMLLKPENKAKLAQILTYHVVAGRAFAADVVKVTSVKSVQGSAIKITAKNGKVMANNATIVATDINASNGVVHVIDQVIMPPAAKN
ncbi:MAG: transforming growth factor-beta-induced protein [Planctomycetota bacterium]|jgi:transforming growth factor-beta-induced protein